MSSNLLGVGIIGLGIGQRHLETALASKVAFIAGICDTDLETLAEATRIAPEAFQTSSSSELINHPKVDVVVIASYDSAHGKQVIEALKAGKKVFVEKPLCTTHEELEMIVRELREKPSDSLSTNMPLRTRRNFIELKNLVSSGFFGSLYLIEADYMYGRIAKLTKGWRGQDPEYSVTLGGGIHMVDLVMWLSDSRVSEVSAFGTKIATEKELEFGNPDTEIVNIRLENGVIARVSSNFPVVSRHHHRVALFGTEKTYLIDSLGESLTERVGGQTETRQVESGKELEFPSNCLESFLESVAGQSQAVVSMNDTIWSTHVALTIKKSLTQGSVELVPRYVDGLV